MEVKFKPQTLCNPRKACGRAPHLFLSTFSSDCSSAECSHFDFCAQRQNIFENFYWYLSACKEWEHASFVQQQKERSLKNMPLTRRGWYVKDCSICYRTCHPFPKPPIRAHRDFLAAINSGLIQMQGQACPVVPSPPPLVRE